MSYRPTPYQKKKRSPRPFRSPELEEAVATKPQTLREKLLERLKNYEQQYAQAQSNVAQHNEGIKNLEELRGQEEKRIEQLRGAVADLQETLKELPEE